MPVPPFHFKSRSGCLQCKQRKIKCGEEKPSCRNCERHRSSCSYLKYIPLASRPRHHRSAPQTSKTSQSLSPKLSHKPRLDSLPHHFTTLDLELLHFYTTTTSNEILGPHMTGTQIWRTSVVTLSFAHPFLLHSLFSLSALHLVFLHSSNQNPTLTQKYSNAATLHHMECISQFRSEIQNITPENSNACCACAWLLSLHAWATPGGQGANLFFDGAEEIAWYKLHRGGNEVVKSAFHWVEKGPLLEMIRPWLAISLLTPTPPLLESVEDAKLDYIAECWTGTDLCTEDKVALEETLQALRYVFTLVEVMEIVFSACVATLSWTTLIPGRFCEMVEERCPQALTLVAIYCVLLKRIEEFWWIRRKPESLLAAVKRELPDMLVDKWLKWPTEEIEGNGKAVRTEKDLCT